jgi:hypothetical protein
MHIYDTVEERDAALADVLMWMGEGEVLIQASHHWGEREMLLFKDAYDAGRLTPIHPNGGPFNYLDALNSALENATNEGKKGVILAFEAKHLQEFIGSNEGLMRYEVELNLKKFDLETTILCQYDRSAFSPSQLQLAESIHQMKLEKGKLERNFWVVYNNYWK